MSDLARIEHEVAALPERGDLTPEQACQLITDIDTAVHRARDAKAALEAFLIEWLPQQEQRELVVGTVRYVVTDKRKVKCRDVTGTVRALLDATGGDIDAACGALSSGAVKYGEARKLLGPRYDEFFETTVERDLEQKPVKQLARLDERFTKGA